MIPPDEVEISFVIPCRNEEGNLQPLIKSIIGVLASLPMSCEVIVTDDASTDRSWSILREMAAQDGRVRVQRFRSPCGESAASWAGVQIARGRVIVTLDADLQNDLGDLPLFLEKLKDYDCVCGTRVVTRHEGDSPVRILSSKVANGVRNWILGDNITDAGCTYRAFRRSCVARIKFFRGAHRFLPALFRMEGFTVVEIPVKNNPRLSGGSHYKIWNRLVGSFVDLLGVWWLKNRSIHSEIIEEVNVVRSIRQE